MIFNQFNDVISQLKRDYELKRLNGLVGDARRIFVDQAKSLISVLLKDINPNATAALPTHWTDTPLLVNATHLLIYREYLGLIALHKEEYDNHYSEFLKKHAFFHDAISRNNPFMLHEHLLHLGNIIARYQDMRRGVVAPCASIMVNIATYKWMLKNLQAQINSFNHDKLGSFADYLKTLFNYTMYVTQSSDQADLYLNESIICARIGALFEAQADNSALAQFYTCGQGLFARTPLKSFEGAIEFMTLFGPMPIAQWENCVTQAKLRFQSASVSMMHQVSTTREPESVTNKDHLLARSRSRSPSPAH